MLKKSGIFSALSILVNRCSKYLAKQINKKITLNFFAKLQIWAIFAPKNQRNKVRDTEENNSFYSFLSNDAEIQQRIRRLRGFLRLNEQK